MQTPHFTYLNGEFYDSKGEKTPLADIPEGTYISFYDSATARPRYIAAEYVQDPQLLLFMSEESPYAEHPEADEEERKHLKDHYLFLIEELKRQVPHERT
jgi:hypothetical protein